MRPFILLLPMIILTGCSEDSQEKEIHRMTFGPFYFEEGSLPPNPIDAFNITPKAGTVVRFGAVIIVTSNMVTDKIRLISYPDEFRRQYFISAVKSDTLLPEGVNTIIYELSDSEQFRIAIDEIIGLDFTVRSLEEKNSFGSINAFVDIEID